MRLVMFGKILYESFDRKKKMFISADKLAQNRLSNIQGEFDDIVNQNWEQKEKVKLKKTFHIKVDSDSEAEAQNLLNSILKITYPYISQARKLTNMNKLQENPSGARLKFSLLPEALPFGYKDKTSVIIGLYMNYNGNMSVVTVDVWKSKKNVYYEHQGKSFYKAFSSNSKSEPVDMEGADSASLTIYLTGKAQEEWSEFHGDYKLIEDKDKDKPVYRNIKGKHLYCQKDGTWAVSFIKGETHPVLKSSPAAASPALAQTWEYREVMGSDYQAGAEDIKVTYEN